MGENRYLQGPDILMRRRSLLFFLGLYGTPCE